MRMGSPTNHFLRASDNRKSIAEQSCLDDGQSVGNWLQLLVLLVTGNLSIMHRWALRRCNDGLKERDNFLRRPITILVAWGSLLILALALSEHSTLVLGLLVCLVTFLAATYSAISRSAFLTTKALGVKHISTHWAPWTPLSDSALSVTLPTPLPPPRATA